MFKEYFLNSVIQYNKIKQHFRVVKVYGRTNSVVIDGAVETWSDDLETREKVLNSTEW